MSNKIQEILDITQEECAEVIQSISKCRRFGLDNSHKGGKTQRENLTQELGDLLLMVELLVAHNVVDQNDLHKAKINKSIKLAQWSTIYND